MKDRFTFTKIENEKQLISHRVDEFAATFDHSVSRLFPIWIGHLDGKLMTYCHTHSHVVAYPAVDPRITPRQMYVLGWQWLTKLTELYGDPLVAMPKGASPDLYAKIGLKPFNKDVYAVSR